MIYDKLQTIILYRGNPGEKGSPGPKGEQGIKGDPGEQVSDFKGPIGNAIIRSRYIFLLIRITYLLTYFYKYFKVIPTAARYSKKYYTVTCSGPCRRVSIKMEYSSGDADLCAR